MSQRGPCKKQAESKRASCKQDRSEMRWSLRRSKHVYLDVPPSVAFQKDFPASKNNAVFSGQLLKQEYAESRQKAINTPSCMLTPQMFRRLPYIAAGLLRAATKDSPPNLLLPSATRQVSNLQCQLSTVNCQLSTVNCQLSTVNCRLSTVNCQLSTVNCQLSNEQSSSRADSSFQPPHSIPSHFRVVMVIGGWERT